MCLLLAFGAMTSLELFIAERAVFIRERANGYYHSSAYFLSKILFDVIPLRVIPPILLGSICYFLMGLRQGTYHFLFFILCTVLFNVTVGGLCLMVGVIVPNVALGNIIALAANLYFMLFGGFLINTSNPDNWWSNLKYTSPFQFVCYCLFY